METAPKHWLVSLLASFRQDHAERWLYGDSVVDAYIDVNWMRTRVQSRFPGRDAGQLARLTYAVLRAVDRGECSLG